MDGSFDPHRLGLPQRLLDLRQERWRSECRASLLAFAMHALRPEGLTPQPHHRLIIAAIERVLREARSRQLILAPRGAAKSTYMRLGVAHAFAKYPRSTIIAMSHSEGLAREISELQQGIIEANSGTLGYGLQTDAKDVWRTTNGCTYYARGAGQGVRGLRADWAFIDDPIKSWSDAESEAERATLWRMFQLDLKGCLQPAPTGGVVMIATAYHEDDIVSRLEHEQGWPMLRLSAVSEGEAIDPLNRPRGVYLAEGTPYGDKMAADHAEHEKFGWQHAWEVQYQGMRRRSAGTSFCRATSPSSTTFLTVGRRSPLRSFARGISRRA